MFPTESLTVDEIIEWYESKQMRTLFMKQGDKNPFCPHHPIEDDNTDGVFAGELSYAWSDYRKRPATPEEIEAWKQHKEFNNSIGFCMIGTINGHFAIDTDNDAATACMQEFCELYEEIAQKMWIAKRGDHFHFHFMSDSFLDLQKKSGVSWTARIAIDDVQGTIELKKDIVALPPSVHKSGMRYEWVSGNADILPYLTEKETNVLLNHIAKYCVKLQRDDTVDVIYAKKVPMSSQVKEIYTDFLKANYNEGQRWDIVIKIATLAAAQKLLWDDIAEICTDFFDLHYGSKISTKEVKQTLSDAKRHYRNYDKKCKTYVGYAKEIATSFPSFIDSLHALSSDKTPSKKGKKEKNDTDIVIEKWYYDTIEPTTPWRYVEDLKKWIQYNPAVGRYEDMPHSNVFNTITDYCRANEMAPSSYTGYALSSLRNRLSIQQKDTIHDPWICCDNCLLNYETMQTKPHDPNIVYYHAGILPQVFDQSVTDMPKEWVMVLEGIEDLQQRDILLQYMVNILHKFNEEAFCIIYGSGRAGKGTIGMGLQAIFGGKELVSTIAFSQLGETFTRSLIYDKWLNIDMEMKAANWDSNTEKEIKTLTARDGIYLINIKGVPLFNWNISCYWLGLANRLPSLDSDIERAIPIMNRLHLIEMLHTAKVIDETLKERIQSKSVSSQMFSYLMNSSPKKILPKTAGELDEHARRQWFTWMKNANWIVRATNDLVNIRPERLEQTIDCDELYYAVKSRLEYRYNIPDGEYTEQIIKRFITQAIKSLGGTKTHTKYLGVQKTGEWSDTKEQQEESRNWEIEKIISEAQNNV